MSNGYKQTGESENNASRDTEHNVESLNDIKTETIEDEEDYTLPKWEWLLISAAAFRAFLPIIILLIALITIAGFLLWSVVFGM